ncbi:M56 family metallopeptidase [Rhodanobacter sp. C01]|uniref:M56 family metallopeptidase n=1 Tax=Rhodanobacter sp. C01 TaxID=1945856 RepID=UPI0009861D9E|nr:M56 family metallopeptidase [Rhodanobacter sp. C01]OOG45500.1 hypothetical protein B0E50_14910 [Rhodanobacter sp. C01]
MNSIESASVDWIGHGWLLILAFTAAVLVVAALRKPCCRLFGAERAFQLWLLPPLAMVASQLSHAPMAQVVALPAVVFTITSAATTLPAHVAESNGLDWRTWMALLWLAGMLVSVTLAAIAQSRYRDRLHGATRVVDLSLRWPVWRAAGTDVGPALVGAWRIRIVLPADFEHRYDATERALILAHETMHARRHDGWWCLLAQAVVAVFWFHPLAWWLLSALRHDQELACDAAVLREHGTRRRSYVNAMLKTQSATFALPIGCSWSPRHPLMERIAMLKQNPPNAFRRLASGFTMILLIAGFAGAVYAAVPPGKTSLGAASDRYTLKMDVAFDGKPAEMHFTQCLKPGEYVHVSGVSTGVPPWKGRFAVMSTVGGQIEIHGEMVGGTLHEASHPIVRTKPGQLATILFGTRVSGKPGEMEVTGGEQSIKVDLTPSTGC